MCFSGDAGPREQHAYQINKRRSSRGARNTHASRVEAQRKLPAPGVGCAVVTRRLETSRCRQNLHCGLHLSPNISAIAQCAERTGHATPMSIPVGGMFSHFVKLLRIQSSVRLNIKGTTAQKDTQTRTTATRAQRSCFPCVLLSCFSLYERSSSKVHGPPSRSGQARGGL